VRTPLKRLLARLPAGGPAQGATLLIYHRVGGGSPDERDLPVHVFAKQVEALTCHDVVSLDTALDRLDAGDRRPSVVLTFDDGFADVHTHAWPLLRARGLPFTLYLTAGLVGSIDLAWEGSTATESGAALSWDQVTEMAASGLCTVANHTLTHTRPDELTAEQLDGCSDLIEARTGSRPQHFAYTWGIEVPHLRSELAERFRSVSTGRLGRNLPETDRLALRRVPVRGTDPIEFFEAKLVGPLRAERAYGVVVAAAKRLGVRA
jgi:peptidoglycan/xylan/chitin deacetylase (PgdA/CDA1 family)